MAQVKRIMISLPENLLQEIDMLIADERCNRSEFIRKAMRLYIQEQRRLRIREQLIRGYVEMASLNLDIANENMVEDEKDYTTYDSWIAAYAPDRKHRRG